MVENENEPVDSGSLSLRPGMSMRRKVLLSGLVFFSSMILVTMAASPILFERLGGGEALRLFPSASFVIPSLFGGDISPDGSLVALATSSGVEIRELPGGKLRHRLGPGWVWDVHWSPGGDRAAFIDGNLSVWNLDTGDLIWREPYSGLELTWLDDSTRLAILCRETGLIEVRDAESGDKLEVIAPPSGYTFCRAITASEDYIATAYATEGEAYIVLYDSDDYSLVETHAVNITFDPPGSEVPPLRMIRGIAWNPNHTSLSYLVANWPGTRHRWYRLELWMREVAETVTVMEPFTYCHSYVWSPDGGSVAYIGNQSHSLGIYNLETASTQQISLNEGDGWGTFNQLLGYGLGGELLVTALPYQCSVRVLETGDLSAAREIGKYAVSLTDAEIYRAGDSLISIDGNGRVLMIDVESGGAEIMFEVDKAFYADLEIDEDRVYVSTDMTMASWDMDTRDFRSKWNVTPGHPEFYGCLASHLSPDRELAALLFGHRYTVDEIQIRRMDTGETVTTKRLTEPLARPQFYGAPTVKWSPRQDAVAFTDYRNLYLWNTTTGEVNEIGTQLNISALAWHPREPFIVTGGMSNETVMWDTRTGQPVFRLHRRLNSPAFSPDGGMLTGGNRIYRLGDDLVPEEVYILDSGETGYSPAWGQDDRQLVVITEHGLHLYHLPPEG